MPGNPWLRQNFQPLETASLFQPLEKSPTDRRNGRPVAARPTALYSSPRARSGRPRRRRTLARRESMPPGRGVRGPWRRGRHDPPPARCLPRQGRRLPRRGATPARGATALESLPGGQLPGGSGERCTPAPWKYGSPPGAFIPPGRPASRRVRRTLYAGPLEIWQPSRRPGFQTLEPRPSSAAGGAQPVQQPAGRVPTIGTPPAAPIGGVSESEADTVRAREPGQGSRSARRSGHGSGSRARTGFAQKGAKQTRFERLRSDRVCEASGGAALTCQTGPASRDFLIYAN